MNRRWYLDLNRFARATPWAHGFMAFYALIGGLVALGLVLLVAWWRARTDPEAAAAVAAVLWAGVGAALAVAIGQPINHLVAEARPYDVLRGVEVLVPRTHDFSFPSDHATVVGAVIAGLWLAGRDRPFAVLATVVGFFLAFSRVYVGAHYPGDVVAGVLLGAVVVIVLRPLVLPVLYGAAKWLGGTPFRALVLAPSRIVERS